MISPDGKQDPSSSADQSGADPAPVSKLLVANRGEMASRIFRTAVEMGISTVAVFVAEDRGAPFVRAADEAVRLADDNSYLSAGAIVAAAERTSATAVHPGYGFGSENAEFARAITEAGLTWIGPTPETIELMGDKLAAKEVARAASVPILESTTEVHRASEIGYPILIKASAGGGGKGMHIVTSAEQLTDAVAQAKREAASAFGDETVFLERYLAKARHVEVQILGDAHGNLIHLGERECSIQRRHQKIIEESPSPGIDESLRQALCEAALALGRQIGYSSAGTIEFIVDGDTSDFYFLEANTRLQVEHPVTEETTGVDLVRQQILIAAGEPLGLDQAEIESAGHAIEARLYAEDPSTGFLPATGTIEAFADPTAPSLRFDSGIEEGTQVGVRFDPMLAKIVATAPNRIEATNRLIRGLRRLHLGGIVTNREFLIDVLSSEEFKAGDTTTDFLDRVEPSGRDLNAPSRLAQVIATLAGVHLRREAATTQRHIPTGFTLGRLPPQRNELVRGDEIVDIQYQALRDGSFIFDDWTQARLTIHGSVPLGHNRARLWGTIDIDGWRCETVITVTPGSNGDGTFYVQTPQGTETVVRAPRFKPPDSGGVSGGLVAPMPGVVLSVEVGVGKAVTEGATLVVLEAMKMEQHVKAPVDGTVTNVLVTVGDQVDNGALLLVLE